MILEQKAILSVGEPSPSRLSVTCTLFACLALSVLVSLVMSLADGEFRSQFTRGSIDRVTDFQPFARQILADGTQHVNPAFAHYIKGNRTAGPMLTVALVKIGFEFDTACAIVLLLYRTIFGVGFSWLVFAATRRRWISFLSVFFIYWVPIHLSAYSLSPSGISGMCAPLLLLASIALLLFGFRKWSFALWVFIVWLHPITFILWSPLYLGMFALYYWERRGSPQSWLRWYSGLLITAPVLLGAITGGMERLGFFPVHGGVYYWALMRSCTWHSMFLFTDHYFTPLYYLAQVVALFLLSFSPSAHKFPLRALNALCACLGFGIWLMYAVCVETQWGTAANMSLPLRFENIMYCLLLTNLTFSVLGGRTGRWQERAWAIGYILLLWAGRLSISSPLFALVWLWALGQIGLEYSGKRKALFFGSAIGGVLLMMTWIAFGPCGSEENRSGLFVFQSPLLMLSGIAISIVAVSYHRHIPKFVLVGLLLFSVILCAFPAGKIQWHNAPFQSMYEGKMLNFFAQGRFTWKDQPLDRWVARDWNRLQNIPGTISASGKEILHLVRGDKECTPEKEACDWLKENVPAGTSVLTQYGLYVHLVSNLKTTSDFDLTQFFIYAPQFSEAIVKELLELYGIDLLDESTPRRSILTGNFLGDNKRWLRLRDRMLTSPIRPASDYQYLIEFTSVSPNTQTPVFENSFIRVYKRNTDK
ncbi:TPA: hypothetical protein DDW35_08255 [Candidatus Sumerlaeota bacterium]|nr:hypothetical protein [Candidatus Sumerlaeota bacterium]